MPSILRRTVYWALVAVAAFNALSAVAGGIAIVLTSGLGMPLSRLSDSPFTTFVVPGLILSTVVGGTQWLAAVLMLRRVESALFWSAVAGFGMLIWIYVEIGIVGGGAWLQALYFGTGLLQLILVLSLLGVVAWLPRQELRDLGPTRVQDTNPQAPFTSDQERDSPTA